MMKNVSKAGLFLASYEIGGDLAGGTRFMLSMTVFTPERTVNGSGEITQSINPPTDVRTRFSGSYDYMTVVGSSSILLKADGFPVVHWPPHAGTGPVLMPNLELTMVLNENWQSGTANYRYRLGVLDGLDDWREVKDAPVKAIPASSLEAA